jgi:hypothetical protein
MQGRVLLLAFALIGSAVAAVRADEPHKGWLLHVPSEIEWRPSDSLPAGAQIAVLEGDPSKDGYFAMRIKMPDGYRVPAHWHSAQERVTVLTGTLHLGSGDKFEASKTKPLAAGTYSSMAPRMTHFAWMQGETILQLTSMGPWTITYVDPADDPRKKGR